MTESAKNIEIGQQAKMQLNNYPCPNCQIFMENHANLNNKMFFCLKGCGLGFQTEFISNSLPNPGLFFKEIIKILLIHPRLMSAIKNSSYAKYFSNARKFIK